MNWLDGLVIVILIIPTFIGFRRGLVRTVLPLLGIVAGVIIAGMFYRTMAGWLSSWLTSPDQANLVAFIIIFALFVLVGLSLLSLMRRFLILFRFGWGGFTSTVLPLGAVVLGIAVAGLFYRPVGDWLSTWLESSSQARIVAFVLVFVLVLIAAVELYLIVSSFATKPRGIPMVGWVGRVGGVLIGLVIGAVLSGAILSVVAKYSSSGMEDTITNSSLAPFFLDHFPFVLHLLPSEFETVRQFFG